MIHLGGILPFTVVSTRIPALLMLPLYVTEVVHIYDTIFANLNVNS
jgi:hypothetical protein